MFKRSTKRDDVWKDGKLSRAAISMKPSRSVDFSRMSIRASVREAPHAASHFSRRAARGSYSKDLFARDGPCRLSGGNCNSVKEEFFANSLSVSDQDPLLNSESWSPDARSSRIESTEPVRFTLPRFSLVKLSVVFLAFASLTDLALTKMATDIERPRSTLGSAALASVTDTLSPILPFAGGLDLRRDDYWSTHDGDWFGTLKSVVGQVSDAFAQKKDPIKIENPPDIVPEKQPRSKKVKTHYIPAISASKPFVSLDIIGQLTLGEVAETFRYATESSESDFNESRFLYRIHPRVKTIIFAMKDTIKKSRGKEMEDWIRVSESLVGEVDALKFCAAMRVFAEWRLLRQVPDGYKGFSVGMSLGHKDVVQNIVKIEQGVHSWIDHRINICESSTCIHMQTPTLRELLSFEIETGLHQAHRLPRLKEKSAGMGLLWVRRQMAYQTHIFDNLLHLDSRFPSMKVAVGAAYTEVYDKYHGWAVQKIFNYSFQAAPDAEKILRHMNPHRLKEVMNERTRKVNSSSTEFQGASITSEQDKNVNPMEQLLNHIGGEWDKLASNVVSRFHKKQKVVSAEQTSTQISDGPDEAYVTQEMVKDAHVQIESYLEVANPILAGLATLFSDLNMDDPTRV